MRGVILVSRATRFIRFADHVTKRNGGLWGRECTGINWLGCDRAVSILLHKAQRARTRRKVTASIVVDKVLDIVVDKMAERRRNPRRGKGKVC